jgi:hypothetical protein
MPTNKRYRTHSRRAAYPRWIARALENGRSDYDLSIGLYALQHGLPSIPPARNREPEGRLDPDIVRRILRDYGDLVLDDIADDSWLTANGFLEGES